ncbi:MAG: hypothetical protein AAGK97_07050, partial [Bacteroidota bacterium]
SSTDPLDHHKLITEIKTLKKKKNRKRNQREKKTQKKKGKGEFEQQMRITRNSPGASITFVPPPRE